jgi:formylglycine-generating enzyme required for sulfatase activity
MDVAKDWPVLASYDELSAYAKSKGGRLPTEPELRLFLDTYDVGYEGGANVAFRNWHPVPATMGTESCDGKGSNGGVWEWTSTKFDTHDGLVPTNLFTGYSTDFFDTKHHVVLGASYATIPRLARKSVRNFYQHNYPYPWVGARIVYDVDTA